MLANVFENLDVLAQVRDAELVDRRHQCVVRIEGDLRLTPVKWG